MATKGKFSKMITRQINDAEELIQGLQIHKHRLIEKVAELLKQYHNDENQREQLVFQLKMQFDLKLAHLQTTTQAMGEADLAHSKELLETQQARTFRDDTLEKTFTGINSLKTVLLGSYGEEALLRLGITGMTPRHPVELERWLKNALNVANKGLVLPAPLLADAPAWSVEQVVKILSGLLNDLRGALEQVSREQQEDKGTLTNKWRFMEEQKNAYAALAGIAESYARMVGDHDLGQRLRPRPPRASSKSSDEKRASSQD